MNSKDKPKRGEAKPFVRETKPRSTEKPAGKSASKAGFKAGAKVSAPAKSRTAAGEGTRAGAPRSEKPAKPFKRSEIVSVGASSGSEAKPERISKLLARVGIASRRDVERMIMEGRVALNGKLLDTPVVNVTLEDKIEVDGAPIRGMERTRLWLYHKPGGLVTTNADPEGRPTVFDNLPEGLPRVLSIGRLDINTEGLLLLTNDGGLSRTLELPTTGWLRRYRVRAHGEVDQEALDKLKDGIAVDGVLYGSIEATLDRSQGRNVWITMGLREGKNREIKNVLGALGLEVNRLIRISYGPFQLGDLPEGEVLEVRGRTLRDQLGPRLIDEAKANFDAPLYNERADEEEKPSRAAKPEWAGRPERSGGGRSDDRRENALSRLDTKRDDRKFSDKPKGKFGDRPAGKFGPKPADRDFGDEKPKKRPPMGTSRTANVWMAPGARPTADGKGQRTSARAEAEQLFKKPSPENDRRVVVNRAADEDGDWIRADGPDKPEKGGFGGRSERGERGFGDKPRGERSFGDRPQGDRPKGDRPFGDRKPREDGDRRPRSKSFSAESRSERPRSEGRGEGGFRERPRGDGPRGERGFDKPRGERSFGDRKPRQDGDRRARSFSDRPPRGDRPAGDRPFGDKPFGGKPSGGRGKPGGGKSFGGKPSGGGKADGRPGGGRPGGGRPGGGRPGGGRPGGAKPGGRPAGKPRNPRG